MTTWNRFDPQLTTRCERIYTTLPGICNTWRMQGTYIDSGENWQYHSIRSVLEYNIEISEANAYVEFEYKVSAEPMYDFLIFSVNNQVIMRKDVSDWTTFRFNFTSLGFYTLTWAFQKDISFSSGDDIAKIRRIDIVGGANVAFKCTPCAPGYFGNGQEACQPCPINTYAPTAGSSSCKPCPPSTSSFPGSAICYAADVNCTNTDYYFTYTPCNPATLTRTKTAVWIEPETCNRTTLPLPSPVTEPCQQDSCPPGKAVNSQGECSYCAPGTASQGGNTPCTPCGNGQAADRKTYYYDQFNSMSMFQTGCTGECRSNGWRAAGSFMDSGIGNGISESFFSFQVGPVARDGNITVSFEYILTCISGILEFSIDGILWDYIECSGCKGLTGYNTFILELPHSTAAQTILVNYRTKSSFVGDLYSCDRAIIRKISVSGTITGGSAVCDDCRAGTFSNNYATCDLCPAGTSSIVSSTNCTDCPINTFSKDGAPTCRACGNGTIAPTTKSSNCIWRDGQCSYISNVFNAKRLFSWNLIDDEIFNNQYSAIGERGSRYFLNLCGKNHPQCQNSFACKIIKNTEVVSLGNTLSMSLFNDKNLGVRMLLSTYDQAACYKNATGTYSPYTTNVYMTCRPPGSSKQAYGPIITAVDQCTYDVQFYRIEACPLCTNDDWYMYTTDCIERNGQYVVESRYMRKSDAPHTCFGGIDKSNMTTVESCIPYIREAQSYWWVFGIIGAVAILVAVSVIIVAIVIYMRYRKLYSDFQRLNEDHDTSNQAL